MFDSRVLEIKRIKRGEMREEYAPCIWVRSVPNLQC